MGVPLQYTIVRTGGRSAKALQGVHGRNRGKNTKHQTIEAASAVEAPVELHSVSVKGLSRRLAILIVIFHPVRKSVNLGLPAYQSIRQHSQRSCFFVCNMLDFPESLTNYLKYRRVIGT